MKNGEFNELKKILNKIYVAVVIVAAILLVNTVVLINKGITKEEKQTEVGTYDVSSFKEIEAKELVEESQNEKIVVYVGRSTCSWCVKFVPILDKVAKEYDIKPYYIDIAKIIDFTSNGGIISQDNYNSIMALETVPELEGYLEKDFGATPMMLIVENGKLIASQTGYVEADGISSFLNQNGFVK